MSVRPLTFQHVEWTLVYSRFDALNVRSLRVAAARCGSETSQEAEIKGRQAGVDGTEKYRGGKNIKIRGGSCSISERCAVSLEILPNPLPSQKGTMHSFT